MTGTKASYLDEKTQKAGLAFLRFDYRGHGLSSGRFEDGTIGMWLDDALEVLDKLTQGPQVLVGSSMGGWIGLLLARARPERITAFIGISAAPDFTKDLIEDQIGPAQKKELAEKGYFLDPSAPPDHPTPITARLIEEGRNHLILQSPLAINMPVYLLQGQQDKEVPWEHATKIATRLESQKVRTILIKDGDHRLSRPQDLSLLWRCIEDRTQAVTTP